jgi:iron(II)-dependent oxidoreductase
MNEKAASIASKMDEARKNSLALFDLVREESLHESPGFGFRPIIWHLAHIGVFEGYWLLQRLQEQRSIDPYFDRIFDPINTPREASVNLPSREEMESYLRTVRSNVLDLLERIRFDEGDPLLRNGYIFDLVLQHEYQHQETLAYLFQLLDPAKKIRPHPSASNAEINGAEADMILIPAGRVEVGAACGQFVYDNELPRYSVDLPSFKIDRRPVTNQEFSEFISEQGYERRELWSVEGWEWRERERWSAPLYWTRRDGTWFVRTMFDDLPMRRDDPVTGISWHEAEAYARFVGKRLPTEAEWEKAAAWNPASGTKRNFAWGDTEPDSANCNFDLRYWSTTPAGGLSPGASSYGCLDMTGNVWEWTADPFLGYDGFEPFPYPEYSKEWFDGDHRVLKGGSWATRRPILRASFRNFFRRQFRIAFAGLRCAADA